MSLICLEYLRPGILTWTCPENIVNNKIQLWIAGAAGGNGAAQNNTNNYSTGGAGVTIRSESVKVIPKLRYTIVVGEPGLTAYNQNGAAGGKGDTKNQILNGGQGANGASGGGGGGGASSISFVDTNGQTIYLCIASGGGGGGGKWPTDRSCGNGGLANKDGDAGCNALAGQGGKKGNGGIGGKGGTTKTNANNSSPGQDGSNWTTGNGGNGGGGLGGGGGGELVGVVEGEVAEAKQVTLLLTRQEEEELVGQSIRIRTFLNIKL